MNAAFNIAGKLFGDKAFSKYDDACMNNTDTWNYYYFYLLKKKIMNQVYTDVKNDVKNFSVLSSVEQEKIYKNRYILCRLPDVPGLRIWEYRHEGFICKGTGMPGMQCAACQELPGFTPVETVRCKTGEAEILLALNHGQFTINISAYKNTLPYYRQSVFNFLKQEFKL